MAPEDALLRERTRILRGRILEALHRFFTLGRPVVQITQLETLLRDHRRDEIEAQVKYLIDKGYAADATNRLDKRDRRDVEAVRITATGIDLAEATIDDEGVTFGS